MRVLMLPVLLWHWRWMQCCRFPIFSESLEVFMLLIPPLTLWSLWYHLLYPESLKTTGFCSALLLHYSGIFMLEALACCLMRQSTTSDGIAWYIWFFLHQFCLLPPSMDSGCGQQPGFFSMVLIMSYYIKKPGFWSLHFQRALYISVSWRPISFYWSTFLPVTETWYISLLYFSPLLFQIL